MNSYFVCLTISRRNISFEYHQEGASKSLAPFPAEESWPVPLALYCTSSKIEIGHAAERAAARGVPGAFKEWFQHLSSGDTVSYLGQQQPVSHLLLLAAEEQLRTFLKDVRYNMDGGLENCRASMPLVLSFEDDVNDSMRIFLVNLFRNMGYGRIYELFHNRSIASYHGSVSPSDHLLIVDSDGVDLTLSLYVRGQDEEKIKRVMLNAGTDPRIQSICNMIWDKTGAEYSFLDRMSEQPRLEQMAAEIISANEIEYEGTMHYSNGERLSFIVSRSELIASGAGSRSVVADVVAFLDREAGIKSKDVTVVLRNFAAKSDYFSQAFSVEFPSLLIHEEDAIEGANKIIVNKILPWLMSKNEQVTTSREEKPIRHEQQALQLIPDNIDTETLKEKTKQWRQIKAEANSKLKGGQSETAIQILKNFLSECESIVGTEEICSEINDEITKISVISVPVVDKAEIKRLERDWREVRASAKGKVRGGSYEEARVILNVFLQKASHVKGTDTLQDDVRKELNDIPKSSVKSAPSGFTHVRQRVTETVNPKAQKTSSSQQREDPEGESLIKEGKLKEARDWYRSHNEMGKAGLLTDIIRSKKGIDLRKNSLEEYRKSKNKDQINRIIKEIEEFIGLCVKVSLPCDSYKKLLNDYKRI